MDQKLNSEELQGQFSDNLTTLLLVKAFFLFLHQILHYPLQREKQELDLPDMPNKRHSHW